MYTSNVAFRSSDELLLALLTVFYPSPTNTGAVTLVVNAKTLFSRSRRKVKTTKYNVFLKRIGDQLQERRLSQRNGSRVRCCSRFHGLNDA